MLQSAVAPATGRLLRVLFLRFSAVSPAAARKLLGLNYGAPSTSAIKPKSDLAPETETAGSASVAAAGHALLRRFGLKGVASNEKQEPQCSGRAG